MQSSHKSDWGNGLQTLCHQLTLLLFLSVWLSSCGYRFGDGEERIGEQTITIPYIAGDVEGKLTASLIEAMGQTGRYEYRKDGGQLLLTVSIVNNTSERIDFRFDREPVSGKRKKNLIAIGNRRIATAEVTLVDTHTDEVLFGPKTISATADFDYDNTDVFRDMVYFPPGGPPQTIINFSLGQLDSIEGAHDSCATPTYRHLAEKIVDGIMSLGGAQ